jgi:uncharacterized heparinase superfamily protein
MALPAVRSRHWPDLIGTARRWCGKEGGQNSSLFGLEGWYRFLNRERQLSLIDWSVEYESPLWTYHLHYLDTTLELARTWQNTEDARLLEAFVDQWGRWIDAAERGAARIEPYPTSVRCMNALRTIWEIEDRLPTAFCDRLLRATHAQLVWLSGHLERHLGANHLQKNLTALTWGSLAFNSSAAESWARYRDELWVEFREQVLLDGGHFERSPMYHAAALDDYLRTLALCRATGARVPDEVPGRLGAMTRALQLLSRPDGTLHLFNDAANGERPGRNEVVHLARRVLEEDFSELSGVFALDGTGYYGFIDNAAGHRLVVDAGPLGPAYQPGHAHCDMLSFELDLAGRPVVVDSGVHGYDGDPYREYVRSTRAHNTVAIDGLDQHETWATFRVARRGEIVEANCREVSHGGFEFDGACVHYHDRRILHRRSIELRDGHLTVTDRIEGADGRPLTSWLHLHPDFRLEATESGFFAVADASPKRTVLIEAFGVDEVHVRRGVLEPVQGWYCPEFGKALDAAAIVVSVAANDGREFGYRLRGVTP